MKKIYLIQQSWANEENWQTIYAEETEEDAKRDINRALKSREASYFKWRIRDIILYEHVEF